MSDKTSTEPPIQGKWALGTRDNLDAFLTCCGVNWFVRTMICNLSGEVEFLPDTANKQVLKKTTSRLGGREETLPFPGTFEPARTMSGKPEVGEIFFESSGGGGDVPLMVQEMKWKDTGDLVARIERRVAGDELHVTFKCKDVVAKEVYNKVPQE